MTSRSLRALLAGASLLVLAACAESQSAVAAPEPGSAPAALDLGGSSRVRYVAGLAGEGEGYGAPRLPAAPEHASMPGMDHGANAAAPQSSAAHAGHDSTSRPSQEPQASAGHAGHGTMPAPSASAGGMEVAQAGHVEGTGTVNSIDTAGHKVNLSHSAIPAIGWPAMTMDFPVAPSVNLTSIKPGAPVTFMMERGGDGMYVIHSITPAGGGR